MPPDDERRSMRLLGCGLVLLPRVQCLVPCAGDHVLEVGPRHFEWRAVHAENGLPALEQPELVQLCLGTGVKHTERRAKIQPGHRERIEHLRQVLADVCEQSCAWTQDPHG